MAQVARSQSRVLRARAHSGLFFVVLLLVSLRAFAGSVMLAWDPVTSPVLAGYKLHHGPAAGNYTTTIDVGNATSHTVSNLTEGATYHFAVTAYDSQGVQSAYSNDVAATIPSSAPLANFSASATSGPAPLALNFINSSTGSITSYAWSFGDGTTSTAQNPAKVYSTPGIYTVALTVAGPGGTNTKTIPNYIAVTTQPDTIPPTVPTGLVATASGTSSINLTWTASTDNVAVAGYLIERCQGANCTSFVPIATPTGTSYSNTGLTAATTYRYRVRATDTAGNLSTYSGVATATTAAGPDTTPPTAPTGLVPAASGTSSINLTWIASTDNVGVTGYRIERCQGASCTSFVQIATSTGTSYSDTGVTAATTYRYQVLATDAAGNLSPYSSTASATTATGTTAPVAAFTGTPRWGVAPLTVNFTSTSTGTISTYAWTFGDTGSAAQNPSHVFKVPGVYTVKLTVTGPGGSNTTTSTNYVIVSSSSNSGALTGAATMTTASETVDLTGVGASDWAHWPANIRKATGGGQVSNYAVVGSANVTAYSGDARAMTWTDGTPTSSGSRDQGVQVSGLGNGFQISAPADNTLRTLVVYVGGDGVAGTLTARVSDGSAADFVSYISPRGKHSRYNATITLTYRTRTAGQAITLKWIQSSRGKVRSDALGNVRLQAVALSD